MPESYARFLGRSVLPFLLSPVLAASATAQEKVETIFVVPGSHLDLGFTDTPRRVLEWRAILLDDAIQAALESPEFYWFEEAALAFDAWWSRNRDEHELLDEVRRLFHRGQIGVGATRSVAYARNSSTRLRPRESSGALRIPAVGRSLTARGRYPRHNS